MYGNNNLFITINKNQSQPGSQHRIQISEQTELARMLIDLLGKPPTEQTKGLNPVSLKRYKKIFAKLSELDAEDKASLYPQLTSSVQVLLIVCPLLWAFYFKFEFKRIFASEDKNTQINAPASGEE